MRQCDRRPTNGFVTRTAPKRRPCSRSSVHPCGKRTASGSRPRSSSYREAILKPVNQDVVSTSAATRVEVLSFRASATRRPGFARRRTTVVAFGRLGEQTESRLSIVGRYLQAVRHWLHSDLVLTLARTKSLFDAAPLALEGDTAVMWIAGPRHVQCTFASR